MADVATAKQNADFLRLSAYYPWMCLFTVSLGAIICYFIPIYFIRLRDISNNEVDHVYSPSIILPIIEKSIASDQVRMSLLSSVVIAIPMFVDTLLDCLYPLVQSEERILWYSKIMMLISLTVPNFLILMRCHGSSPGIGYVLAFNYSRMAITGGTIAYASQIALKYRMKEVSRSCWVIVSSSILAFSLDSYSYILNPSTHQVFRIASAIMRLLSYVQFVYCVRTWLRQAHSAGQPFTSCEVVIFIQLLAALICSIMYGATAFYYGSTNFLNTSSECICVYTYIQMLYTVVVMTIPGRIAKFEVSNVTQSIRERQAFIRYISHEIRTPLNTVFLGLEYVTSALKQIPIQESQSTLDPIVETVSDVYSSCEVAISILNDLLTFDKIEGGKMTLEPELVNCCSYFTSLMKPFNLNARGKLISFHLDLSELSPTFIRNACINVDQAKMGQVARNLISNALKFTPHGGTVTVSISHVNLRDRSDGRATNAPISRAWPSYPAVGAAGIPAPTMDMARIEVRDTGAGISLSNQAQLFGQYVQFNANKLQQGNGSGLGLWISKGITELHGGIIGAFSEGEGKGSMFYVELPVTTLETGNYDLHQYDDVRSHSTLLPKGDACQRNCVNDDYGIFADDDCVEGKVIYEYMDLIKFDTATAETLTDGVRVRLESSRISGDHTTSFI